MKAVNTESEIWEVHLSFFIFFYLSFMFLFRKKSTVLKYPHFPSPYHFSPHGSRRLFKVWLGCYTDQQPTQQQQQLPFFISPKIVKMTGSPGRLWHL